MRRSKQVVAPILASAAVAMLAGCRPDMQRCVDEGNRVVDPGYCNTLQPGSRQTTVGPSSGAHIYRYYYGGGGSYAVGSTATEGSYVPESGRSYSTTSGTARGGFGSSFSGSGGEGGEGAHGGGAGE
jgi:hypothetical protein